MQLCCVPTDAPFCHADYEMLRFHPCAVGFGCVDLACAARGFDAAPLSTGLRGSGIDVQVRPPTASSAAAAATVCLRSDVRIGCDTRARVVSAPVIVRVSVHPLWRAQDALAIVRVSRVNAPLACRAAPTPTLDWHQLNSDAAPLSCD